MDTINIRDLLELSNPIIIDIRTNYHYNMGHIKGAISIPYYNLLNNYSHYLNQYSTYYMYCESGEQSLSIARRLNKFGYHVISVAGGYLEYQRVVSSL